MVEKIILDKHDVMTILGISNSTLFRKIKNGELPKPFKMGDNTSPNKWRREDIEAFTVKAASQTTNS